MKKTIIFIFVFLVSLIVGGCTPSKLTTGGETTLGIKMMTAKQGYEMAIAEAKKFSSDSFLTDLDTTGVKEDGTSNTWYVLFFSPMKNTNYKVNVVGGKVERAEEGDKKKKDRIVDGWTDSTNVVKVAIPKCKEVGEVAEPNYFINLNPGKNGENPVWNFNCLVGENKTFKVYIDGLTGEFTKTGKAGIGW